MPVMAACVLADVVERSMEDTAGYTLHMDPPSRRILFTSPDEGVS